MYSIWTESYIVYDGKKIYLETPYSTLKKKMNNKKKKIELKISNIVFGKKRIFEKCRISEYGEAGLI